MAETTMDQAVWLQPPTMTQFTTDRMLVESVDEQRDDAGNVTVPAQLSLRFASCIDVPLLDGGRVIGTAQLPVQGYQTGLTPHEAIRYLEDALELAREAAATMGEQPLDTSALAAAGFSTARSMDDVDLVADAMRPQPIIPRPPGH